MHYAFYMLYSQLRRRTLKLLVISRPLLANQPVEIARELLDLGPVELAVFGEHPRVECDRARDFRCGLRAMLVSDLDPDVRVLFVCT